MCRNNFAGPSRNIHYIHIRNPEMVMQGDDIMKCPICMRDGFTEPSGDTHYVCVKDPNKPKQETGCGTQFTCTIDDHIRFPHNIIFKNRSKDNFYKYDYLNINPTE